MKKILGLLFIVFSAAVFAQEEDPIITDRPTQSAAASVVPLGNFLVEAGFISEKTTANLTNTTFGNFHFRYGLFEGVEIRLTQNYLGRKDDIRNLDTKGFSPLILGTKIHLMEEDGMKPQMSVIGQITFRNGDNAFRPADRGVPEVRFNFANTLSDQLSLGYNLGMSFPKDNPTLIYTVVLGYSFADKWTAFVEPYGMLDDDADVHQFNTGIIYLCSNNIQFDISAGWGLSNNAPNSFIGFGAAIGF